MGNQALLTFGRLDVVRVRVGYRASPEDLPDQQFLLDVSVQEPVDEELVLGALEPVLHVRSGPPRHYSLHQHRWHTSWGASPGAPEIGLLVTTGTTADLQAPPDGVTRAFRDLLALVGRPEPTSTTREAAIVLARRGAATVYAADPDTLSLSAEEHHPPENSRTFKLRTPADDAYEVVVGFVDGYAGSVRVQHEQRIEVSDSLGAE
ncbi:hypothetical protein [Nocardioides sp. B-3]|uniref:hypothetical protein n=1 Tax=Nocardioides sp. B-3 TaxID=2895565 RepID=UPI0021531527|nr:hypothetical protein [Nocardioides sp. B-3]UUZ57953.1 hypothetical protein LP418_16610 [Nocardioides sp. B-3]